MTVKLLKQQHSCTKADKSATNTHGRPRPECLQFRRADIRGEGAPPTASFPYVALLAGFAPLRVGMTVCDILLTALELQIEIIIMDL